MKKAFTFISFNNPKAFRILETMVANLSEQFTYFTTPAFLTTEIKPVTTIDSSQKEKSSLEEGRISLEVQKSSLENGKTSFQNEKMSLEIRKSSLEKEKSSFQNGKMSLEVRKSSFRKGKSSLEKGKNSFLFPMNLLLKGNFFAFFKRNSLKTNLFGTDTSPPTLI